MSDATTTDPTSAEATPDAYHYTRTSEVSGHTVRARMTRHHNPDHCFAVAEVWSEDSKRWTTMAVHLGNWLLATPTPRPDIDPAHELDWIAMKLINRAGAQLAPAPEFDLSPYAINAAAALLATTYSYGGEETISPETIVWALSHGGPFRVIEHADGNVTFTKAHRADCPFITSSGTRDCDEECSFD